MLALAQNVLEEIAARRKTYRWKVSYRLRYGDIEVQAFVFQTPFTEVPRSEVAVLGPFPHPLAASQRRTRWNSPPFRQSPPRPRGDCSRSGLPTR